MPETRRGSVLFVIYNEIGLYPPTINAIELTASQVKQVFAVELITHKTGVVYNASNIKTHSICFTHGSKWNSFQIFLQFVKTVYKIIRQEGPEYIVVYDSIAGMAIQLLSYIKTFPATFWYHSHDAIDRGELSRFTLMHFSTWFQKRMIGASRIFSLPAKERLPFYPVGKFSGKFVVIPNYPSKRTYAPFTAHPPDSGIIRMVYQGRITDHHGLEEVIQFLPNRVNGKDLRLVIKGIAHPIYKSKLDKLIQERKVVGAVEYHGLTSYQDLPAFTSGSHIGIAIFTKQNLMNSTLGTASNKVYEYTACGMPFLYYRNEHFDFHFRDMPWAVGVDGTEESLLEGIQFIDLHYEKLSAWAKRSFLDKQNFEYVFKPELEWFLSKEG